MRLRWSELALLIYSFTLGFNLVLPIFTQKTGFHNISAAPAWLGIDSSYLDSVSGGDGLPDALDAGGAWMTDFSGGDPWFVLDLGVTYDVQQVRGRSNSDSDPTSVDMYVSTNGVDWGAAVASGINTWVDTVAWQTVDNTDKEGRYVKFVITNAEQAPDLLNWGDTAPDPIIDLYGEIPVVPSTPVITLVYPTNGSTGIPAFESGQVVKFNYTGGASVVTLALWTNASTGSWHRITNPSKALMTSGSWQEFFDEANDSNTKYWFKIMAKNASGTTNNTYHFTTTTYRTYDWISPDSTSATVAWMDEAYAIDKNMSTWAYIQSAATPRPWIYLNLTNSRTCDRIRFSTVTLSGGAEKQASNVTVEMYYDDAWNEVWDGNVTGMFFKEVTLGSNETVQYTRLRINDCGNDAFSWGELWDFQYGNTTTDSTPPSVVINFAGNLSDHGGPAWRPPEYNQVILEGHPVWGEGYYTNDSCQIEEGITINVTVTEPDSTVQNVWLNWLNKTGESKVWTNWTYPLLQKGDFWIINTTKNITTKAGSNYSFDIVANSTGGSTFWEWNKTGVENVTTRRYVQLNCSGYNLSYKPYYLFNATYDSPFKFDNDVLHHDQGTGTVADTGYLLNNTFSDTIQHRYCGAAVWYWFDESLSILSDTRIKNIYYHVWFDSGTNHDGNVNLSAGVNRTTAVATTPSNYISNYKQFLDSDRRSGPITTFISGYSFSLATSLLTLDNPVKVCDNNISEFAVWMASIGGTGFTLINSFSNSSANAFVLFNVPDNATLNASYSDSDLDGLSDWYELYRSYTNPFLRDTDNDGINDYFEDLSGSDPNNYSRRNNISLWYVEPTWNISFKNIASNQSFTHWNISFKNLQINTSQFHWNTSFRNSNIYDLVLYWNTSFKSTSSNQPFFHWNTSFKSTSLNQSAFHWNVSFKNSGMWYKYLSWNISFRNTTLYVSLLHWNTSFNSIAVMDKVFQWNTSFKNSAETVWYLKPTWNTSFKNVAINDVTNHWNVSFKNSSEIVNNSVSHWNTSFKNSDFDVWDYTLFWNTSFRNSSTLLYALEFTWNTSFKNIALNQSSFHYNISFKNSAYNNSLPHYNISFRNSSMLFYNSLFHWNVSFRNSSLISYQSQAHYNISFQNSSQPAYNSLFHWNTSFRNSPTNKSALHWNTSFKSEVINESTYHWNTSFKNSEVEMETLIFSWNTSFKNSSAFMNVSISHWNISFKNSSIFMNTSLLHWNISFKNTVVNEPVVHWNISFRNTSLLVNRSVNHWNISFRNTSVIHVYVDDNAPADWYNRTHVHTIQEGFDNVSTGGIVYVWDGTYTSKGIINKTLSVIGNGSTSILQFDRFTDNGILVNNVDDVNISYLTILGSNISIYIDESNNVSVFSNNLNGNGTYALRTNNAHFANISNNNITSNGSGVYLYGRSPSSIVQNNYFHCYSSFAIATSDNSDYSILRNNTIELCDFIIYSDNTTIFNNSFKNSVIAILLATSNDNFISNNTIVDTDSNGFFLGSSSRNRIVNNTVTSNLSCIYLDNGPSLNNWVYNNMFTSIGIVASDFGTGNKWNFTKTAGTNIIGGPYIGGNYYSNNTGNSVGDGFTEPYHVTGSLLDYYPLGYPKWLKLMDFNISFKNSYATVNKSLFHYNISFRNTIINQTVFHWNTSFSNSSVGEHNEVFSWNTSFRNSSLRDNKSIFSWNVSFQNTSETAFDVRYSWNTSFRNSSVFVNERVMWWNTSFRNSSDTVRIHFISQTPSVVWYNSTDNITIIYNITTNYTRISNFFLAQLVNFSSTCFNWSYRYPPSYQDDFTGNRSHNRNEDRWFEIFNKPTGSGEIGYYGEWGVFDNSSYELHMVAHGSNWTLVNLTLNVRHFFPQQWYLDRTNIQDMPNKRNFSVYNQNYYMTEFNMNYTDFYYSGAFLNSTCIMNFNYMVDPTQPAPLDPLQVYYVNSSYTSGNPATSPYAQLLRQVYPTSHPAYRNRNSSYWSANFTINETGFVGTTGATAKFYIAFVSKTPPSKPYYLKYAWYNYSGSDFNNTNLTQYTSNNGGAWTTIKGTIDVWGSGANRNGSNYIWYKMYANDSQGNENWSAIQRTQITPGNVPPNPANVIQPNATTNYHSGQIINLTYRWLGDPNLDSCWINASLYDNTTHTYLYPICNHTWTYAYYLSVQNHYEAFDTDHLNIQTGKYDVRITVRDSVGHTVITVGPVFNFTRLGLTHPYSFNISFRNTTIYDSEYHWNISFANRSIRKWNTTIAWNIFFKNVITNMSVSHWNITFRNSSALNISIDSEFPANKSSNIPRYPTTHVKLTNYYNYRMNITWSWGFNSSCTEIMGHSYNESNGYVYMPFSNASSYSTTYYWAVYVEDGNGHNASAWYYFRTEVPSGGGGGGGGSTMMRDSIGIVGIVGLFGLLAIWFKKKKRRED